MKKHSTKNTFSKSHTQTHEDYTTKQLKQPNSSIYKDYIAI
jgi:hypothetical protein